MEDKIQYFFDSETKIFHKNYHGEIFLEEIFESWEKIIQDKKLHANVKRFVINYKDAIVKFSPSKAAEIAGFYKKHDDIFAGSKIAMVMVTPDQAVFPHLVGLEKVNFQINLFYTLEAAVNWLMIGNK